MNLHERKRGIVREPIQERGKEKKAAIIITARRLFNERGYDAVTSNLIAYESGVAIGTFYSYFKDKNGVLIEVARGYFSDVQEELLSSIRGISESPPDLRETVNGLITAIWKTHQNDKRLQREIIILSLKDKNIEALIRANDTEMDDLIGRLFSLYADRINIDDREAALRLIRDIVHEVIHRIILMPGPIEPERVLEQLMLMILRYLSR
jgi:AcrR family transcriptional regulator